MMGPQATAETVRPMAAQIRDASAAAPDAAYAQMMTPQINGMVSGDADRQVVLGWALASDRGVVARALYDDVTLDLRPRLAAIRTPIVLLYPNRAPDPAKTDQVYLPLYAGAPAIALKRVDSARHFIMLDQPQAFADALDAFLARN